MAVSASERLGLGVVALLLLLGAGVRILEPEPATVAPEPGAEVAEMGVEVREAVAEKELRTRPLAPGELIDVNRASPQELDRLPGIGPVLGGRIARDRSQNGRFRSLDDLDRVPGIGPATLEELRPHVSVSP
ncbi:MAG: ComEA family DNA-binding protein [Longimicrobiaceae bacterium]